jgi:uncharacterized protein (DUF3084 family)
MTDDAQLLRALHDLHRDLSSKIEDGLEAVQREIAVLSDSHNRALLEQERRNSEFATRDRVEAVASNVHSLSNNVTGALLKIASLEKACTEHQGRLDRLTELVNERAISFLSTTNGQLFLAALTLVSVGLAFVLGHLVHP